MSGRHPDWRMHRLVALDFETTGLDPKTDEVISYGAVPIVGGRIRLAGADTTVIDPGRAPSAESVKVHQLRPVDVAAGASSAVGMASLSQTIADDPIVVWTAWVESAFLARSLGGSTRKWMKRIIDIRPMIVRLDERSGISPSPARTDGLLVTAERFGIPPERGHDALADAFLTAQLLLVAAARLERNTVLDLRSLQLLGRHLPPTPG